jgi:hypothetical protein
VAIVCRLTAQGICSSSLGGMGRPNLMTTVMCLSMNLQDWVVTIRSTGLPKDKAHCQQRILQTG